MAKEKEQKVSNEDILNSIREVSTEDYKSKIPLATKENLIDIAKTIMDYPTVKNEFINTLTNQVTKSVFLTKLFNNPFKFFKKGNLPYGKTIETIFIDLVERKSFSDNFGDSEASSLIGVIKPDNVKPEYHSENFQNKYKISISDSQIRGAVRDENGLQELINRLTIAPLNTAEFDEFRMIKKLLSTLTVKDFVIDNYNTLSEEKQSVKLSKVIKTYINKFRFLSTKFNSQGVNTFATPEEIVVLVTPETKANIDIDLLSSAFNLSKAEIESRLVLIDEFINEDGTEDIDTLAMVIDENMIQFWETENTTESFRNSDQLTTNTFYHRWGIMSATGFVNGIKIKKASV